MRPVSFLHHRTEALEQMDQGGEVMGVGTPGEHGYEFKGDPALWGEHLQAEAGGPDQKPRFGPAVKYPTHDAQVTWSPTSPRTRSRFSAPTLYGSTTCTATS